jgi:UDP-N-acetylmuramoylalanine--D-glutamate ligase
MVDILEDNELTKIVEPVAVFGIGVEGRSTIDYLLKQGVSDVTALDRNEIKDLPTKVPVIFGADHDQNLGRFATIFRSPGIRPDHPSLVEARAQGSGVTSAVSHFLVRCKAPVVGITGTVGKGTTASLIANMLQESGFTVHLGGNIGQSPLEFLHLVEEDHRVVLEISSFQAMDIQASPHVAVVLKTTSEHLDWHVDLDEYLTAKAGLLANQRPTDVVVYNANSKGATFIASKSQARRLAYSLTDKVEQGLFLSKDRFVLRREEREEPLPINLNEIRLPGRFNLENIAASILAAVAAGGAAEAACRVSERFEGLPHRLEFVAKAGELSFYNDSYATRPEASLGALSCFEGKPLALILGGSEKYADFSELALAVAKHPSIVHVALIGNTAGRLGRNIENLGPRKFDLIEYDSLESAMGGCVSALRDSGTVLLSPACASFGLFRNYKVRGERFRAKAHEIVKELESQTSFRG